MTIKEHWFIIQLYSARALKGAYTRTWEITIDFKDGKKVFVETGDIDKIITELERKYPDYNAVSYRVVDKGGN